MTLEDLYRLLCSGHVQTQGIVDTIQSPLVVLDGDLRIASGKKAFFHTFQLDAEAANGMSVFALGDGQWDIPELRQLLDDIIPKSSAIVGYELTGELPGKGQRNLLINARRLVHPDNNSPNLLLEIEDITERRRAAATKDILLEETRHRMRNLLAVVRSLANQTRTEGRSAEDYRAAFLGRLETVLHAQEFGGAEVADLQRGQQTRRTCRWTRRRARQRRSHVASDLAGGGRTAGGGADHARFRHQADPVLGRRRSRRQGRD
jgi:hypothetical protein